MLRVHVDAEFSDEGRLHGIRYCSGISVEIFEKGEATGFDREMGLEKEPLKIAYDDIMSNASLEKLLLNLNTC